MPGFWKHLARLWRDSRIGWHSSVRWNICGVVILMLVGIAAGIYAHNSAGPPSPALTTSTNSRATVTRASTQSDVVLPSVVSTCSDDGLGIRDDGLQALVDDLIVDAGGRYAIVVKSLQDCRSAAVLGSERFPSASLYKLFVMYAAYAERQAHTLDFDETLVVTEESLVEQEDTLVLEVGDELTVSEAVQAMVEISDNACATLLLQRIGPDKVQAWIEQIGLKDTCVECSEEGWMTTPHDIALFFDRLAQNRGLGPPIDQEMLQLLALQQINDRLPNQLPEGTLVAHKTGDLDDIRHDGGIVYAPNGAYILVVMADQLDEPAFADERIAEMSRAIYDYLMAMPNPQE